MLQCCHPTQNLALRVGVGLDEQGVISFYSIQVCTWDVDNAEVGIVDDVCQSHISYLCGPMAAKAINFLSTSSFSQL